MLQCSLAALDTLFRFVSFHLSFYLFFKFFDNILFLCHRSLLSQDDLVRYFTAVGGFQVTDLKKYDFSSAEVKLVAGIPGQFEGSDANHWGLRRLKKLLQDYKLPKKTKLSLDKSTDILMQFSR